MQAGPRRPAQRLTRRRLDELVARRAKLEALLGEHRPDLRRGETLELVRKPLRLDPPPEARAALMECIALAATRVVLRDAGG